MNTIKVNLQRRKIYVWLDKNGFEQLIEENNLSIFEDSDGVLFVLYNGYMLAYKGE